jgi:Holliday junction resolvasome RuvABC endonuclease subunit
MAILVIDPGYKNLGFVVFDDKGEVIHTEFARYTKQHSDSYRARDIVEVIFATAYDYCIDQIVFEDYVITANDPTGKSVKGQKTKEVVGIIKSYCIENEIPYHCWKWGEWKAIWKRLKLDRHLKNEPMPKMPCTDNEHVIDAWQQGIAYLVKEGVIK